MIEQKSNPIQPPPSVEDLLRLSVGSRVGQVDFANRLVPDSGPVAADPVAEADVQPDDELEPAIEPEPEPTHELTPVELAAVPTILPVAQLDPFVGELYATPAVAPVAPAPHPAAPTVDRSADDLGYLGLSVQEVADSAIERLRDAENATLQHLAAVEVEAARRVELLTAQAELDAELIRITARREAHVIISDARVQTGKAGQQGRDARQLSEISDAVSRFAESIQAGLTPLRPTMHEADPT